MKHKYIVAISFIVIVMFVMMAFSSDVKPINRNDFKPSIDNSAKSKFISYAYNRWGKNSSNNKTDSLKYSFNIDFINWYYKNYNNIPQEHRRLYKGNMKYLIKYYEATNQTGKKLLNELSNLNFKAENNKNNNYINTSTVIKKREGNLISNTPLKYKNGSARLLTYSYKTKNYTIIYELIKHGNKFTVVDPTVRVDAFKIHHTINLYLYKIKIPGTSYNTYFDFNNYSNALLFKQFVTQKLIISSIVQDLMALILFAIPGTSGVIVGIIGSLVNDLEGTTSPLSIAHNINTLFKNEEGYSHDFRLVFTLNEWEYSLLPEFAVWGRINPGNSLFEVFKTFEELNANAAKNYLTAFTSLENKIGYNNKVYISGPTTISAWDKYIPG